MHMSRLMVVAMLVRMLGPVLVSVPVVMVMVMVMVMGARMPMLDGVQLGMKGVVYDGQ
jgi:hypothetical protein